MHATENTADTLKAIVNGRLVILVAYRRFTADAHDGRYAVAGRDLKHHNRLIVATVDTRRGTYENERGDVGDWTPEAVNAALAERVAQELYS